MAEHTRTHEAEYLTTLNKHFPLKAEDLMTLNKHPSPHFTDVETKLRDVSGFAQKIGGGGEGFWILDLRRLTQSFSLSERLEGLWALGLSPSLGEGSSGRTRWGSLCLEMFLRLSEESSQRSCWHVGSTQGRGSRGLPPG